MLNILNCNTRKWNVRGAILASFFSILFIIINCSNKSNTTLVGPNPKLQDSILWVETDTIEHTRDYYSFQSFVNNEFPQNWLWPINYSEGRFTLRVHLLTENDVSARPIYYSVGWKSADGKRFTRVTVFMNKGPGVYEWTDYIKNAENVVNGYSNGSIGDNWEWQNAWKNIAGDAWGSNSSVYPFKVVVKLTLHK